MLGDQLVSEALSRIDFHLERAEENKSLHTNHALVNVAEATGVLRFAIYLYTNNLITISIYQRGRLYATWDRINEVRRSII